MPMMAPPHNNNLANTNISSLTKDLTHERIQTIFRAFDPNLSGYIDVHTFEVMCHSLGLRVDLMEIQTLLEDSTRMKTEDANINIQTPNDERKINYHRIDLSTAKQLLTKLGYAHRKVDDEMKMYFRSLDIGNKGYITLEDLRRLQSEVNKYERKEINTKNSGGDVGSVVEEVGDISLQAMIDLFDVNHNGVIDYDEFSNILGPSLFSSLSP